MRIPYSDGRAEIIFCGSGSSNGDKQFLILYNIISRQVDGRVPKTLYAGELTDLYRVFREINYRKGTGKVFCYNDPGFKVATIIIIIFMATGYEHASQEEADQKNFHCFFDIDSRLCGSVASYAQRTIAAII
jgi:hypothetical protein